MHNSIKQEIEYLKTQISIHDYNYYILADPKISDYEYDQLYKKLVKLEKENPQYITSDSPTQRVGSDLSKEFQTVEHNVPMLSLSNTYNEDELFAFDKRIKDSFKKIKDSLGKNQSEMIEYVAELKIDGVSVSLKYDGGELVIGATRGDGMVGEDITPNVKTIKSIPLKVYKKDKHHPVNNSFEVRGEIFITRDGFNKMNKERENSGLKLFANPRNSAAGTLKLQDPRIVSKRPLDIFVYYLIEENNSISTHADNLEMLKNYEFKVNPHFKLCRGIEDVIQYCRLWEKKRESLPYETDGVVIKVNSLYSQHQLGSIAKSPRWAVAFKFKAQQVNTQLNKITWQVGRTGTLTPVAELTPVLLAGSTISRATLHNIDEIKRKDIRENDTVKIEKGGDVIPKVVEVDLTKRPADSSEIEIPTHCPVCGTKIIRSENEVAIYCENLECPAQVKGKIKHFAARGAMDIEGLGDSIVELLVDLNILKSYSDIYNLNDKKEELINLERFGKKSVENLLVSIEKSKEKPFSKVLFALGIRFVGAGVAKKLVDNFRSMENIINASEDKIKAVNEIGPRVSASLKRFLNDRHNLKLIDLLTDAGLNFSEEFHEEEKSILKGKSFVLTGTLSSLKRNAAKEKIELLGGNIASGVSKNTDYVVVGDSPGSKVKKAEELNIEILNEEEFLKLLGDK